MNGKKRKNKTARLIDVMIRHADKGPSGFWTDDYEGCGNPKIFPEFEAGLKHGEYVHKDHYLCPWNTAVLYGDGHGNINTGCYYSCSIREARLLSSKMLEIVLTRFKERICPFLSNYIFNPVCRRNLLSALHFSQNYIVCSYCFQYIIML